MSDEKQEERELRSSAEITPAFGLARPKLKTKRLCRSTLLVEVDGVRADHGKTTGNRSPLSVAVEPRLRATRLAPPDACNHRRVCPPGPVTTGGGPTGGRRGRLENYSPERLRPVRSSGEQWPRSPRSVARRCARATRYRWGEYIERYQRPFWQPASV